MKAYIAEQDDNPALIFEALKIYHLYILFSFIYLKS